MVIDFTGTLDGAPFEGGTGGDVGVNVGSGTFIPGFEDQLIGMGAGETRRVKVTFPGELYERRSLPGRRPSSTSRRNRSRRLARLPSTTRLRNRSAWSRSTSSRRQSKDGCSRSTRRSAARRSSASLLDKLDEMHKFALPPTLAEEEFNNVWNAVENDLKAQGRTFADEGTTEEKAREEYRSIAERRVRLGLVLAEIGEQNKIAVTDDEITRAIVERARQVPGREQEVWEYYRKNPGAVAGIRAPIFEEKVVDFLLELAKVSEKQVSREELLKDDEDEKAAAVTLVRRDHRGSLSAAGHRADGPKPASACDWAPIFTRRSLARSMITQAMRWRRESGIRT